MKTDRYYFEGEKVFHESLYRTEMAMVDEVLTDLAPEAQNIIRNPFTGIELMSVSKKSIDMICELKEIKLNTTHIPYEGEITFNYKDGKPPCLITPCWDHIQGSIKINQKWIPPDYMKLFFIVRLVMDVNSTNYGTWYYNKALLVTKIDDDIYQPPLPNVYSHGEICMGDSVGTDIKSGTPIYDQFKSVHNGFMESSWNSDLLEGQTKYLVFDSDGTSIHPPKDNYKSLLKVISSSQLSSIAYL